MIRTTWQSTGGPAETPIHSGYLQLAQSILINGLWAWCKSKDPVEAIGAAFWLASDEARFYSSALGLEGDPADLAYQWERISGELKYGKKEK